MKFLVVWIFSFYFVICEDGFVLKVRESFLELRGWYIRFFFIGILDYMEFLEVWFLFIYFLM